VLLECGRARFRAEGTDADLVAAGEALERAGDAEAAAGASVLVAHAAWRAGRTADAEAELARARGLLDGLPPSHSLAEVLAETARLAAFANRRQEAVEASAAALQLAEGLGLDELRASVLNTLGVLRLTEGEVEEARSLAQQAVAIASTGSPEALRALTNLAVIALCDGDPAAWREAHTRAVELATRAGDRLILLWLEASEVHNDYAEGRWDDALARVDAFVDAVAPLGGHYSERGVLLTRAGIRASRGDDRAEADLEHALGQLNVTKDAQVQIPTLLGAARVSLLLGDLQRAAEFLDRAAPPSRGRSRTVPLPYPQRSSRRSSVSTAPPSGRTSSRVGRSRLRRCTPGSAARRKRPSCGCSPRSNWRTRAASPRPTCSSSARSRSTARWARRGSSPRPRRSSPRRARG
jgi:tetratricopeptide (TPR) repeat protein